MTASVPGLAATSAPVPDFTAFTAEEWNDVVMAFGQESAKRGTIAQVPGQINDLIDQYASVGGDLDALLSGISDRIDTWRTQPEVARASFNAPA